MSHTASCTSFSDRTSHLGMSGRGRGRGIGIGIGIEEEEEEEE
jgi:hypothetical protein